MNYSYLRIIMTDSKHIRELISGSGLKVTPQRYTVLQALIEMKSHPSADQVIEYLRKWNPAISTGTVYNILDVFTEKKIIRRIKTEDGILRYDAFRNKHHHIYCTDTGEIKDYHDPGLSQMLYKYFREKRIEGFDIEELSLHISGKYNTNKEKNRNYGKTSSENRRA